MFIAFEGIDGSGISTQVALLASWLANLGKKAVITSEPSDSFIGMLIKGRLSKEVNLSTLAMRFLFAADSANEYIRTILPALEQGNFVISDRRVLSGLAYGAVEFDVDWLKEIYKDVNLPNITFYLKIPPRIALHRLGEEGLFLKFFERETYLNKVSENYDRLAEEYPNIYTIDGTKSVQEVHKEVIAILSKKLESRAEMSK